MLSDEHLRGLGQLTVKFQSVENAIRMLVCSFVDEHDLEIGLVLTAELPFGKLCNVLEALIRKKETDQKRIDEIVENLKCAREAECQRNSLVHSLWSDETSPSGAVQRVKHKISGKKEKNFESISVMST